jgi:hypothetical protein
MRVDTNIFCKRLIQSGHIGRAITQTGLKNTSRVASMSAYLQLRPAHIQKSHFPQKADCPIMEMFGARPRVSK